MSDNAVKDAIELLCAELKRYEVPASDGIKNGILLFESLEETARNVLQIKEWIDASNKLTYGDYKTSLDEGLDKMDKLFATKRVPTMAAHGYLANGNPISKMWQSCAQWPTDVYSGTDGNGMSTDKHVTKERAKAVCRILEKNGFGGAGKSYPIKTWVKPEHQCFYCPEPATAEVSCATASGIETQPHLVCDTCRNIHEF